MAETFSVIGLFACVGVAATPATVNAIVDEPAAKVPATPSGDQKPVTKQPAATETARQPADALEADPGLPDLDELLGLPSMSKPKPSGAQPETDKELQRRLSAQELSDAFKQAITLMGDAAERLEDRKDPGLTTQRVQEDVLLRLDELIAQIEQNSQQQQQQSSSSSSQQRRDDPRNSEQAGKQQQQPSQAEQTGGENNGEVNPPPFQEGALRPSLESAPAAWGSLPTRIRDMLLQGASDRFSTTWERATESYYRRLAEQQPQ